jgi:ParB family chromosome partitioning protein
MKSFKRISDSEKDKRVQVAQDPQLLAAAAAMAQGKHSSEGVVDLAPARPQPKLVATSQPAAQGLAPVQAHRYDLGSIVEVPIEELVDNPWNARRRRSSGSQLDKRSKSMKAQGQLVPAKAYQDPAGRICLVDGHERKYSAKNGGIPTLRVEICAAPANVRELYLQSRAANVERQTQSPLDDALAWRDLLEQGVFASQVELATALDVSEATMSRVLGLLKLPQKVLEVLNSREDPDQLETLKMLHALRLFYEATDQEATEELILEIARDGLSARDVDARRTMRPREKVSRERSEIKTHKYEKGHITVKQFDVGRRVVLEVQNVDDTISLEKVTEALNRAMDAILK